MVSSFLTSLISAVVKYINVIARESNDKSNTIYDVFFFSANAKMNGEIIILYSK